MAQQVLGSFCRFLIFGSTPNRCIRGIGGEAHPLGVVPIIAEFVLVVAQREMGSFCHFLRFHVSRFPFFRGHAANEVGRGPSLLET